MRMSKRALSALLSAALCLSLLPVSARAAVENITVGGEEFTLQERGDSYYQDAYTGWWQGKKSGTNQADAAWVYDAPSAGEQHVIRVKKNCTINGISSTGYYFIWVEPNVTCTITGGVAAGSLYLIYQNGSHLIIEGESGKAGVAVTNSFSIADWDDWEKNDVGTVEITGGSGKPGIECNTMSVSRLGLTVHPGEGADKAVSHTGNFDYDSYNYMINTAADGTISFSARPFLTLECNGGKCFDEYGTYTYFTNNNDERYDLTNFKPTRDGYVFDGWRVGDTETVIRRSNVVYDPKEHDGVTTLHAVWQELVAGDVLLVGQYNVYFENSAESQDYLLIHGAGQESVQLPNMIYFDWDRGALEPIFTGWSTNGTILPNITTPVFDFDVPVYVGGERIAPDPNGVITLSAVVNFDTIYRFHLGKDSGATFKNVDLKQTEYTDAWWGSPFAMGETYITPPEGKEIKGWRIGEEVFEDGVDKSVYTQATGADRIGGLISNDQNSERVDLYAVWQDAGTRKVLKNPTDLKWSSAPNGQCSWKYYYPDQQAPQDFVWSLYRMAEGGDLLIQRVYVGTQATADNDYTIKMDDLLTVSDLEMWQTDGNAFIAGDYYFTVQARGNGFTTLDGDIISSKDWKTDEYPDGTWHYVYPEAQLPKLKNVVWSEGPDILGYDSLIVNWDPPEDKSYIYSYMFLSYESNSPAEGIGYRGASASWGGENPDLTSEVTRKENYKGIYAAFCVRAISKDINVIRSGEWSDLKFYYLNDNLQNILNVVVENVNKASTAEDIQAAVEQVRSIDTEQLSEALDDAEFGTGVAKQIEELEALSKVGETTVEDKTDLFSEQNSTEAPDVAVVGAGLNVDQNATGNQAVTLEIDAAADEEFRRQLVENDGNPIPFSMRLKDKEKREIVPKGGEKRLDVPVKIKLPVPESLVLQVEEHSNDDQRPVLLHKHDNEIERIQPHYQKENNKWFASFAVMSFSDFAFVSSGTVLETTVEKVSGGVRVIPDNADADAAYCAVYDTNGQMLGMTDSKTNDAFRISCDTAKASYVKLFFVADNKPTKTATRVDITR